jgi:hypothetical protein
MWKSHYACVRPTALLLATFPPFILSQVTACVYVLINYGHGTRYTVMYNFIPLFSKALGHLVVCTSRIVSCVPYCLLARSAHGLYLHFFSFVPLKGKRVSPIVRYTLHGLLVWYVRSFAFSFLLFGGKLVI